MHRIRNTPAILIINTQQQHNSKVGKLPFVEFVRYHEPRNGCISHLIGIDTKPTNNHKTSTFNYLMIADLSMYLRPEVVDAHKQYWALIKKHLNTHNIDAPDQLSQPSDMMASWTDPALVLSQTCGMPYRNSLHGKVQLVGTPDFNLPDCKPGNYRSAVVVRRSDENKNLSDFQDSTFAFNSQSSQSGYAAAFSLFKNQGFWFNKTHASGSHLASALAVAEGIADIATLDAVTWRLLLKYENFVDQLSVLDWTEQTPGLPYITAMENDQQRVSDSIAAAIEELPVDIKALLGIHGLVDIPAEDYLRVANPD